MAVKSSGQLSLRSDILAEVGGFSYVNLSLRNLSNAAGFSTPDAMSEFYGYSRNRYYISATGSGYLRTNFVSPPYPGGDRSAFSMGLWFRNIAPGKRNQNLIAVGDGMYSTTTGTFTGRRDYILMRYLASLNRIIVEVYNNGTRRLKRDYPLHDYPNLAYTGVANSGTGWTAGQRGIHDGNGFTHISCTVDLYSTTATNSIKVYWMGDELTYSVSNVNSGVYPVSPINGPYASVGEDLHQRPPSGGSWYGDIDNAWIYPGNLGPGVHDAITNLGNVSMMSYFQNNALTPFAVWAFENNTFLEGGSSVAYRLTGGGTYSYGTY